MLPCYTNPKLTSPPPLPALPSLEVVDRSLDTQSTTYSMIGYFLIRNTSYSLHSSLTTKSIIRGKIAVQLHIIVVIK